MRASIWPIGLISLWMSATHMSSPTTIIFIISSTTVCFLLWCFYILTTVSFSQLSSAPLLWFLWGVRSAVRPPHIPGALSATSAVMRATITRGPQTCSVHGQGSGALKHLPAQVCYNLCYSLCETQSNWIFCETTKLDIRWSSGQSMSHVVVIKALWMHHECISYIWGLPKFDHFWEGRSQ